MLRVGVEAKGREENQGNGFFVTVRLGLVGLAWWAKQIERTRAVSYC